MCVPSFRSLLPLLAAAALATGAPAELCGQVRDVVSKAVAVSGDEASLRLEVAGAEPLTIELRRGDVRINGRQAGRYEPGGMLEVQWRALLSEAVALEDGPLAEALVAWEPPADLPGTERTAAQALDAALEEALRAGAAVSRATALAPDVQDGILRRLLEDPERLELLGRALHDVDRPVELHVGEDVTVTAGTRHSGTLVVVDGDLRLEGDVDGDVVVVDGTLTLAEDARVEGAVYLADARLLRNLGEVTDGVRTLEELERVREEEIEARVREELTDAFREDLAREIRASLRREFARSPESVLVAPFRPVIRAAGSLFEHLLTAMILGLLGWAVVTFAEPNFSRIADAARREPARAAAVGFATTLLALPVWILGTIALVVSIVGIPLAIAWIPLFPVVACIAGLLGFLAVAQNVGEWLSERGYTWTQWIRRSNPVLTVFGGIAAIMALFVAADLISVAPFLSFFSALLTAVGVMAAAVALEIGLGAVVLTRGGRHAAGWADPFADAAWEEAVRVDFDVDAGAQESSAGPGGPEDGQDDEEGTEEREEDDAKES